MIKMLKIVKYQLLWYALLFRYLYKQVAQCTVCSISCLFRNVLQGLDICIFEKSTPNRFCRVSIKCGNELHTHIMQNCIECVSGKFCPLEDDWGKILMWDNDKLLAVVTALTKTKSWLIICLYTVTKWIVKKIYIFEIQTLDSKNLLHNLKL